MPFDAPDTEGLIPWVVFAVVTAAIGGVAWLGRWVFARLGWYQDRTAASETALRRENRRLRQELSRQEAGNADKLERVIALEVAADQALRDELEADQVRIARLLETTTPAEPEERA